MEKLSRLTPTLEELEQLGKDVPAGPVVVLNLLKFRVDGGRVAFRRYGALVAPLAERAGAKVVYSGRAGPVVAGAEDWDLVALVRFAGIDDFIGMVRDPVYQTEARALREQALERTLWMVTHPPA